MFYITTCFRLDRAKCLNHNHTCRWFTAVFLCFTFHIFHDHAEVSSCFKRAEHGNNEGVLGKSKDVSLYKSLLDLVPQHQVLTIYLFHGKPLAGVLVADQIHSPEKKQHMGHIRPIMFTLNSKKASREPFTLETWAKTRGWSLVPFFTGCLIKRKEFRIW